MQANQQGTRPRSARASTVVHALAGVGLLALAQVQAGEPLPVADLPTTAKTAAGEYISWVEHLVDGEDVDGGAAIRGGDGLVMADIDDDGFADIVSVHEDSHHLRIAFGSADPDRWSLVTVARGGLVGAIEDVAVGDLNGDGWLDLVAACEEAHLAYLQNPGDSARAGDWKALIPSVARGRGSWLKVAIADLDGDGRNEVVAANKGFADVVPRGEAGRVNNPTSMFLIEGDPLEDAAWREQVLLRDGIPNQALATDLDGDGDMDVLAASRLDQRMMVIVNRGVDDAGRLRTDVRPIRIEPVVEAGVDRTVVSNAFDAALADLNGDGRPDLIVNALELDRVDTSTWQHAGVGWLAQPADLHDAWTFHRIGSILPDWVTGIGAADIDGDGDSDVIVGGYSGLNVLKGGYSGASRDEDDASVTAASSVARLAWFENPGASPGRWRRHDISRRVRGMYDVFAPRDMDGDGDVDFVATRGNSGTFDGVFWLEQRRSTTALAAFEAARDVDSRALPLPPGDWRSQYGEAVRFVAPNKAAQKAALDE